MADSRQTRELAGLSLQQLTDMMEAEYLHAPKGGTSSCRRRHEHKVRAIAEAIAQHRSRDGISSDERVQMPSSGIIRRKSHSKRAPKRGLEERQRRARSTIRYGRVYY